MEKLEKKHHNHSFTECLKNIIFGLVMLAPMLAIAVRCGYVMWNKNAKNSYSGNSQLQYSVVPDACLLEVHNNYYFDNTNYTHPSTSVALSLIISNTQISVCENQIFRDFFQNNNVDKVVLNYNGSTTYVQAFSGSNSSGLTLMNFILKFYFQYDSSTSLNYFRYSNLFYNYYYENNSTLDNAFSYSVSQLSNDPIFNWTRNTGIYTPINAMVSGLEIENDTLQILLAYWSLMTAVYIVFDLIIFCFTKLTHFING